MVGHSTIVREKREGGESERERERDAKEGGRMVGKKLR